MDLSSSTLWLLAGIGLGYLVAQLLIFVLLIYAFENGKFDLSKLSKFRLRVIKFMNLGFGLCLGFLMVSALMVRASRFHLDANHDLVPLALAISSFVFFLLIAITLRLFNQSEKHSA